MDTHHLNALVIGAGRLGRIEMVLAAIVLLLLVGEGSVVAVLRRMLGG